jgi:hypothetical protein
VFDAEQVHLGVDDSVSAGFIDLSGGRIEPPLVALNAVVLAPPSAAVHGFRTVEDDNEMKQ